MHLLLGCWRLWFLRAVDATRIDALVLVRRLGGCHLACTTSVAWLVLVQRLDAPVAVVVVVVVVVDARINALVQSSRLAEEETMRKG
jgi:hypothetical protein